MATKTDLPTRKVDAAIQMAKVSQHFCVLLTPAEAKNWATKADHCILNSDELQILIANITALLATDVGLRFNIGREYSDVMYIEIVKGYYSHIDWEEIAKKICEFAKDTRPDTNDIEINIQENRDSFLSIRIWWD